LVPTSITEAGSLTEELRITLSSAWEKGAGICVEDIKPGRRRWLKWGLPREAIDDFITYNEHSRDELDEKIIKELKEGRDFFMVSDGGTPAFCDPGRSLVMACHQRNINVRMINCDNSLLPAVALSGFTEGAFRFLGFPPKEKDERHKFFTSLFKNTECQVFMDTPYRLERVREEISKACPSNERGRHHFVLMDIERESEQYLWGSLDKILSSQELGKREFVWVLAPKTL
jgi:16S rRNA (cytidine1402-2'-O)-methyltransferase